MSSKLPKVLILHNVPGGAASAAIGGLESDAGVLDEVDAVAAALKNLGVTHRIAGVALLEEVPPLLASSPEPVVFNLVEGLHRRPEEANFIPALCLSFGKACTGNPTSCLELALDKWRAKAALRAAKLPVSQGILVSPGQDIPVAELPPPPWILKPARSDASEGIHAPGCIFKEAGERLEQAVRAIHDRFEQPALIEQFVGPREMNVAMLERNRHAEVLAIAEIDFSAFPSDHPRVVDYAAKWLSDSFEFRNTPRVIPARIPGPLEEELRRISLAAWKALGCMDYARMDLRVDENDRPVILEVNPNPDITPNDGFDAALQAAGTSYDDFVHVLITNAVARLAGMSPRRERRKHPPEHYDTKVRYTEASDQTEILRFVSATGVFHRPEIEIAQELLDEAVQDGPVGHYQSFTAELEGRPAGWICFGPTPGALGTFDIYWIVVSPEHQGKGIGEALMAHSEQLIQEKGGRLVVVETSGRAVYEPTRQFYLTVGYTEQARVPDFYAPGDDKIVFTKHME